MPLSVSSNRVTTPHFYFQRVDGSEALELTYALRHQVYCYERGFLDPSKYTDGLETDRYDENALHFGAFDLQDQMVGTVRLVCSPTGELPLLEHCSLEGPGPRLLGAANSAEISRLAVSKLYRRRDGDGMYGLAQVEEDNGEGRRQRPEIVLGLYKVMYQESKRLRIRFWYAAMESSLWRLLARFAFEFRAVGPEVDYYGPVTPYLADIQELEQVVFNRRPEVFREFTDGLAPELLPDYALGKPK